MADIQIRVVNADQVKYDLARVDKEVTQEINDKVEEFTKDLFMEIVRTSPVKTGFYQSKWEYEEMEDEEGYLITNEDDKAKFLVFPNTVMMGSTKADEPSQGILHNVRGIVFKRRKEFHNKIENVLQRNLS